MRVCCIRTVPPEVAESGTETCEAVSQSFVRGRFGIWRAEGGNVVQSDIWVGESYEDISGQWKRGVVGGLTESGAQVKDQGAAEHLYRKMLVYRVPTWGGHGVVDESPGG